MPFNNLITSGTWITNSNCHSFTNRGSIIQNKESINENLDNTPNLYRSV